MYRVVFIRDGHRIEKLFDSYYLCERFCLRAKHSKKITLVSYPNFK